MGILKSITNKKMVSMRFWELPEADFRKLYAALERKNELENSMRNSSDWETISPKVADLSGLDKDTQIKRYCSLKVLGKTEELFFIASETYDGLVVVLESDEPISATVKPEYWMPNYQEILEGRDPILMTFYSDYQRAAEIGVSAYTYMLLRENAEEFKTLVERISPPKMEYFVNKIEEFDLTSIFTLLGKMSTNLKNRCKEIGFFPLAYTILNHKSSL